MEPKSIRKVLVLIVLALGVVLGVLVLKRTTRGPVPSATPIAPAEAMPSRPASEDKALVRVQRAGAVTAIEKGDYGSAIATLSAIVKSGNGLGDEVELLKVAKELEEKYHPESAAKSAAKPPPTPSASAPSPVQAPAPTPPAPAPAPTRAPARRPAARPTKPAPERAEPVTGLLLVTSVPSGLLVELDGKRADNTPLRRRLEVGPHEVTVLSPSGQTFRKIVTVEEDGIATVDADLGEPAPAPTLVPPPTTTAPEPRPAAQPVPAPAPPPEAPRAAPPSTPTPAPVPSPAAARVGGPVGEVLVPQAAIVGDVFIEGVGYGPPPVLAKGVPAGEATVELRSNGSVKRKKVVKVEAGRRVSVQFR